MTTARTSDDMSVTVTPSVARALLSLAGFKQDERGRWTHDDGRWTWATDEALRWALVTLAEDDDEHATPARSDAQARCLTALSEDRGSLTAWNMIASGDVVCRHSSSARSFALASTVVISSLTVRHSQHTPRHRKRPSPHLPSVTAR
jgi:hypothetical protein